MKKFKILFVLSFVFFQITNVVAQDSTKKEDVKNDKLILEVTLANRYIWRGVEFGAGSPSLQAYMSYQPFKNFEIGTIGCVTTNGTKVGLGNTLEIFAKYSYKNFYFLIDDYYFFADSVKFDNYTDYGYNTNHLYEARLGYKNEKLEIIGGYYFYGNQNAGTLGETVYGEVSYSPNPSLTFFAGGVTGASYLNFMTKGGITSIGITGTRNIKITDHFAFKAKGSLIINPNYKYTAPVPGVNGNFINYLLAIVF
ncbi:MAG: hypothetical protein MUC49_04280 [Raineya sp.]|jgi:hypothetical protein|nr:hypothetical protein [Raineya sp.]